VSSTLADNVKINTVTNPKVNAAAIEKLITARIALLMNAPFFGSLAVRLQLINADAWCSTAATDGRRFYYNSEFVNNMPLKQVEFLVGHEVLHVAYDHMGRRGERDPVLWNIAVDYCVNGDLVEAKLGTMIPTALHSPKYLNWSAEAVYDDLYKKAKKIDIGKLAGQLIDQHLDGNGQGEGEGEGDDSNSAGDKIEGDGPAKGPVRLSKEEQAAIRDEVKEALINALKSTSEENIPGNIKRLIKDISDPKMNWRELIGQRVQSLVKDDYTWMRASRKGWHMDAIMPGRKNKETIDVAISLDSSGSISQDMLKDFLGEVRGLMEEFDDFRITIWCIDTKVYNHQVFTPDNIDEFDDYEIMGNGGNTFEENWRFMRKIDLAPQLFIMFTDGYPCPHWCAPGDETYCDTMFLLHSTESIVAPFGTTVYYKD
jgi:predicted metal-dependent peptidase